MAIAFVQANTAENVGANATTNAFTGNGLASVSATTNGMVFVWVESGNTTNPSSITWNTGGNMTMAVGSIATPGRGWSSLWYKEAPASGAVTLTVNYAAATSPVVVWSLYSGVKQAAPDTNNSGTNTTTPITVSTTTITDKAWLVGGSTNNNGAATAGTDTTVRFSGVRAIGDSNADKSPTGSYSLSFARAGATAFGCGIVSIAPAPSNQGNAFFNFM